MIPLEVDGGITCEVDPDFLEHARREECEQPELPWMTESDETGTGFLLFFHLGLDKARIWGYVVAWFRGVL